MQIQVKIENPSKVVRKLTVTVSAETVGNEFQKQYLYAQKKAKLKGFRPGCVPISVVKKYYAAEVQNSALQTLLDESFRKAVQENQLKPVGKPQVELLSDDKKEIKSFDEGQSLSYVATVEVMPEIELKKYTDMKLTRPKVEVKKKDVESVIDGLRQRQAQLVPFADGDDHIIAKDNYVDFNFDGGVVVDGTVQKRDDMKGAKLIKIGSGEFIPGFEDQLIGLKKTESKTFRIQFPKDYSASDLAGKEAEFSTTINEVKEMKLPEINDEFVKAYGFKTVDEMNTKVEENLLKTKTNEADEQVKNDALRTLIDKNPFDVPQTMIQAQAQLITRDFTQNLKQQGYPDNVITEVIEKEKDNLMKKAESQVRSGLVLEAIANKEQLKVEQKDIENEIKSMAVYMNMEEQKIRDYYLKDQDKKENLVFKLREQQALNFVLDSSEIKQK